MTTVNLTRAQISIILDAIPCREVPQDSSNSFEKEPPPPPPPPPIPAVAIKRTASLVSLTLKDLPNVANDQIVSTITGTLVAPAPNFKTSTQRRLQRIYRKHNQSQQQQTTSKHPTKNENESKNNGTSLNMMPNLLEMAMFASPLPSTTPPLDTGESIVFSS